MATALYQTRIDNATAHWEKAFWMKALAEHQQNQRQIDQLFNRIQSLVSSVG